MLFAADVVAGTHLINAIDLDGRWLTWDKAAFNGAIGTYGRAPDCAEIVWSGKSFPAHGLLLRKLAVQQV